MWLVPLPDELEGGQDDGCRDEESEVALDEDGGHDDGACLVSFLECFDDEDIAMAFFFSLGILVGTFVDGTGARSGAFATLRGFVVLLSDRLLE